MRLLAALTALSLALALLLGGTAPFGRVLLAAGLPGLAQHALKDAGWSGVAAYRAGDFAASSEAFDQAEMLFNLGNAQVMRENYAAALEAYDQAIAAGHPYARINFDIVAAFYAGLGVDPEALGVFPDRKEGPQMESAIARGNARAAGTGTDVNNTNTMMGLAAVESRGRLAVRRVFDDKFMVANDRWLAQLTDVPGEYLAARIMMEYKRRVKLGIAPPTPEDPR